MPRRVVTVVRRRTILPRRTSRRERQDALLALLGERWRVLLHVGGEGVEIAFPPSRTWREAKAEVIRELDALEPRWERLFKIYPTESALRDSER